MFNSSKAYEANEKTTEKFELNIEVADKTRCANLITLELPVEIFRF